MTVKEFTNGWRHFCNHIDFGRSNLDGESIRFMNEMPSKIIQVVEQRDDLLDACKIAILALTHEPINPKDIKFIQQAITKAEKD